MKGYTLIEILIGVAMLATITIGGYATYLIIKVLQRLAA